MFLVVKLPIQISLVQLSFLCTFTFWLSLLLSYSLFCGFAKGLIFKLILFDSVAEIMNSFSVKIFKTNSLKIKHKFEAIESVCNINNMKLSYSTVSILSYMQCRTKNILSLNIKTKAQFSAKTRGVSKLFSVGMHKFFI